MLQCCPCPSTQHAACLIKDCYTKNFQEYYEYCISFIFHPLLYFCYVSTAVVHTIL